MVRVKGLLTGIKLKDLLNTDVRNVARDGGLLVGVAGDNVVRLAPPLNVREAEIETAISILRVVLTALREDRSETLEAVK